MTRYIYIIALVVALVLNATANLLIKASAGAAASPAAAPGSPLRALATNWLFLVGLICFGLNLVAYQFALQKLPISIAYPIMVTCGYAIIVFVASKRMGEHLLPVQWVGVVLILVGVSLVSAYVKPQPSSLHPAPPSETTTAHPAR